MFKYYWISLSDTQAVREVCVKIAELGAEVAWGGSFVAGRRRCHTGIYLPLTGLTIGNVDGVMWMRQVLHRVSRLLRRLWGILMVGRWLMEDDCAATCSGV